MKRVKKKEDLVTTKYRSWEEQSNRKNRTQRAKKRDRASKFEVGQ